MMQTFASVLAVIGVLLKLHHADDELLAVPSYVIPAMVSDIAPSCPPANVLPLPDDGPLSAGLTPVS